MNARVEAAWLEAPILRSATWAVQAVSPQLAAAIEALSAYSLRDPDPTLEDVRLALEGTGFTWSEKGDLAFSSERAALVDELDGLIEIFGRDTKAACLFPSILAADEESALEA